MSSELDNITDRATLAYLVNPNYESMQTRDKKNILPCDDYQFKVDRRFYKKRILSITRELFKESQLPRNIIELHNDYVKQLIEYFKLGDRKDIIQEEYSSVKIDTHDLSDEDCDINTANKEIFNVKEPKPTLDNYVTIKKLSIEPEIIPKKKNIDLKNPQLRTKGVVKKKKFKKDKNKQNI